MDRANRLTKAGWIGLLATFVYFLALQFFPFLEVPNLKLQDFFSQTNYRISRENLLKDRVLLVTIDDESVKKLNAKWPFDRKFYAEVLKKIEGGNASLVAYDFVFSGESDPIEDFLLAEAFRKSGNVILASFVDPDGTYIPPQLEILTAAQASGVVNKVLDRDLYVRRAYLSFSDKSGRLISLPWELEIASRIMEVTQFHIPSIGGKFRINYHLKLKDITQIPFWKAYEEGIPKDLTEGKVVVFAATSHLLHDYYHTSLGLMPGIVINLNFLANILTSDYLREIPQAVDLLLFFIFSFIAVFAGFRSHAAKVFIPFGALVLTILGVSYLLFVNRYLANPFSYLSGAVILFFGVAFYRYFNTVLENLGLEKKASTDPLTGLFNRRVLEQRLDEALEKIANVKGERKTDSFYEVSVLMLDVDDFKRVNDTYGHQFGDDVLKNVSFAIKENTRSSDLAARYGGEEFCVVLEHTSKKEAIEIAEKIRYAIEAREMSYVNKLMHNTVSIGLASAKADNLPNSRAILRAADEALYKAKRSGKNRVSAFL